MRTMRCRYWRSTKLRSKTLYRRARSRDTLGANILTIIDCELREQNVADTRNPFTDLKPGHSVSADPIAFEDAFYVFNVGEPDAVLLLLCVLAVAVLCLRAWTFWYG